MKNKIDWVKEYKKITVKRGPRAKDVLKRIKKSLSEEI